MLLWHGIELNRYARKSLAHGRHHYCLTPGGATEFTLLNHLSMYARCLGFPSRRKLA